jgi:hypothetical protein
MPDAPVAVLLVDSSSDADVQLRPFTSIHGVAAALRKQRPQRWHAPPFYVSHHARDKTRYARW